MSLHFCTQVEEAGERVERELDAVFTPLEAKGRAADLFSNRPSVKYDRINNAVWIRLIRGSKARPHLAILAFG